MLDYIYGKDLLFGDILREDDDFFFEKIIWAG